jgi:hypothetical protein
VKRGKRVRRVVVSADGHGVVSHAGVGLLREMAGYTGLVEGVTDGLIGTYKGVPAHAPGRVFTDLAVALADGADAISGIGVLTDREELFGPVASMPTTWRVLDRLDFDATITIAHSEKQNAAATWKKTFGFPMDARIQGIADAIPGDCWHPALQTDGESVTGRGWPRPPACGTCAAGSSPAAKSQRSATGSSTSPPASPDPHVSYGSGSTRPGGGQPRSPRASTDSAPHSPDHPRPVARPEEPGDPQPGSASRPARHAHNR